MFVLVCFGGYYMAISFTPAWMSKKIIIPKVNVSYETMYDRNTRKEIEDLQNKLNGIRAVIDDQVIILNNRTRKVKMTAYTASVAECDEDPNLTAIMVKPIPGRTVAVSHDLKEFLGHRVYIPGYGVFVIEDLMNERYTSAIDMCVRDTNEAMKIGSRYIEIIIL